MLHRKINCPGLTRLTFGLLILIFSGCRYYYRPFYTDPGDCMDDAEMTKPYEVVIVPGFPSEGTKINNTISERIIWAHYLYKKGYAQNILFSGAAVYTPYIEAEVMYNYALQMDINPDNIIVETTALHSTENLYYGYKLAREKGFRKIAFASHVAQTSFMKQFRRKFKLNLDFLPIVSDSIADNYFEFEPLDPDVAFVSDFVPLDEKENVLKRLRGTRGSRVKKDIRQSTIR